MKYDWPTAVLLGMYVPIVVYSGVACWLYVTRVFVPSIKGHFFRFQTHAVAMAAVMALAAHFSESIYYGIARTNAHLYDVMSDILPVVGAMKLMVMASAILATAVYNKATFGSANIARLVGVAAVLWALGSTAALLFEAG